MKICPICNNKEDDIGAVFCSECGFRFQDSSPNTGKSMMYAPTSLNDSGGEDRRSHGELGYPDPRLETRDSRRKNPSPGKRRRENTRPGPHGAERQRDSAPVRPGPMRAEERKGGAGKRTDDGGISFAGMQDLDGPGRSIWPLVAGMIAVLIIVGVGVWFFITNQRLEKKQKAKINQAYSEIETIYNRQKNDYLEDALEDWEGDKFLDKARDVKDDDNRSYEQKITDLKSVKDEFTSYDDRLAKGQEEELDKSFDKAKDQYNKEFLIEGEEDKLNQYVTDYGTHKDERNYKAAKADIEGYSDLEKNIMNNEEDPSNYSAKAILVEDEFMPQTLDFTVDTDTYTVDGNQMSDSHFSLMEQIGEDGKQKYIDNVTVSDLIVDGDEAKYQLTFSPGKPDNYKKNRLYILHVRNRDGTRGFTAQQGTNPEKMIQKAAQAFMKDFVDAFNNDCGEDSRVFNQMKDYLEKGSQAYDDYSGLPGLSNVYNEQITDASGTEITIEDKGGHVKITTTFSYYIVRDRERSSIMDSEKEKSYYNSGSNKNFSEEEYNGDKYIVYSTDNGDSYKAQTRSDSSSFKVYERLTEYNTFELRIQDNRKVGPIYKHSNDSNHVSKVEGMEYLEDSGKEVYREEDINQDEYEDDGDYEDDDYYDDESDDESVY